MPDARLVTVHKKLAELIGQDFSSGYSQVNMTGRIVRGSIVQPPYTPFGCVYFIEALEDYGPTMGRYQGTANFEAYMYIGGADEAERNDNALNLASDAVAAITANRQLTLGQNVDDVLCSYTALDGDKFGLEGIGIGYIRIACKFRTSDGV
tara:strand:+ start:494 stop:946 length:453 start_codon:yes stop_codon:yes gene_type:complete